MHFKAFSPFFMHFSSFPLTLTAPANIFEFILPKSLDFLSFLTSRPWAVLRLIFQSALRGGKTIFFLFIGAFATKRFARSRIFRFGLHQDILSKRQKKQTMGEGVKTNWITTQNFAPPPFEQPPLVILYNILFNDK